MEARYAHLHLTSTNPIIKFATKMRAHSRLMCQAYPARRSFRRGAAKSRNARNFNGTCRWPG